MRRWAIDDDEGKLCEWRRKNVKGKEGKLFIFFSLLSFHSLSLPAFGNFPYKCLGREKKGLGKAGWKINDMYTWKRQNIYIKREKVNEGEALNHEAKGK